MSAAVDWLRAHRAWLRAAPAVAVAVAFLVVVVRNADTPSFPDYEVPEGFVPAPAPTTAVPGAQLRVLAAVRGTTTTTIPANTGRARLAGVVTGPGGAVPGATVRLERVVGGSTQVLDVVTGADGRYDVGGIGGGRYRVRAFLPPTLAQPTGEVLYLRHDEDRAVDLVVEAFGDPAVSIAFAPNPPLLDEAVNLAVRVSARIVDGDGVVRTGPLAGAAVQVSSTGGWSTPVPTTATTGGDGQAQFQSTCLASTPSQVHVSVRVPASVPGTPPTAATFDVPACVDPATLTTTTSTTEPADGSSTSSSSSSSSTSTTAG